MIKITEESLSFSFEPEVIEFFLDIICENLRSNYLELCFGFSFLNLVLNLL